MLLMVGTAPVLGQFGNIFGPPRPPADVPRQGQPRDDFREDRQPGQGFDPWRQQRGPEPPPPPLTRLPPPGESGRFDRGPGDPRRADPGRFEPGGEFGRGESGRRGSPVQAEPLPPPPGLEPAPQSPEQAGRPPLTGPGQPPLVGLPPGQRQPRGTPQPGMTPAERDAIVVPPPRQRIVNPTAVFAGLDKITARIISFDVAIGETVQFGALRLTPRACYTRPPTEPPSTDGFIEVDEITLQGEVKRIFTGWMFAASPGLHAIEHPIYDIWLTDCRSEPLQSASAAQAQGGGGGSAAAAPEPPASAGRPPSGPVPTPPIVPR